MALATGAGRAVLFSAVVRAAKHRSQALVRLPKQARANVYRRLTIRLTGQGPHSITAEMRNADYSTVQLPQVKVMRLREWSRV